MGRNTKMSDFCKKGWASGSIVPVNNASITRTAKLAGGELILCTTSKDGFRHRTAIIMRRKGRVAPLPATLIWQHAESPFEWLLISCFKSSMFAYDSLAIWVLSCRLAVIADDRRDATGTH